MMQMKINSQGSAIDQGFRGYVERRVRFVLGRFADRVGRVTIYLADVNGPRGGKDKRCRIVVNLVRSGQVFIEGMATTLGAVVDEVADRVEQAVERHLQRQFERGGRLASRRRQLAR